MEFMYNWDNNYPVIEYLRKIYYNTLAYLEENDYPVEYAYEFTFDIEDFFYYFKLKNYDVNSIVKLVNDIDVIEFYDSLYISNDDNNDDVILPVLNRYSKIQLSTAIQGDNRLSAKERRRLYLYHGLAGSLFSYKSRKTVAFSCLYERYFDRDISLHETIVNNGWLLLENTLAEELAEKITYRMLGKIRPGYRPGLDGEEYPISTHKVSSNLEMYRMFQEIIYHFGLTINKIGTMFDYSEKSVLNDMIKYSITNSFSDIVINEYSERGQLLELYQLLYLMGLLFNEKYRIYHMNYVKNRLSIDEVDAIYDMILEMTDNLVNFYNDKNNTLNDDNVINIYDPETEQKIKKLIRKHEI